jgi:hypothetical protein
MTIIWNTRVARRLDIRFVLIWLFLFERGASGIRLDDRQDWTLHLPLDSLSPARIRL